MNAEECVNKSINIVMEYYDKNNAKPYFEHMSENVKWYGIAIGQKIHGLDNLKKAWSEFSNSITFNLGNIEAEYVKTSNATCEVMLMYVVTGHYPNGDVIPAFQRLQFSWADVSCIDDKGNRQRQPRIFMVHISHPIEYHKDDRI